MSKSWIKSWIDIRSPSLTDEYLSDEMIKSLKEHNRRMDCLLETEKLCKYCGSGYHDAKYHPGTCCNCGGPAGM